MKICLLSSSWTQRTSGTHIYVRYANFFAAQGHTVTLFFGKRFTLEEVCHPLVKIIYPPAWISGIPGPYLYNPFQVAIRVGHVLRHRYDVIHVCPGHRPAHWIPAVLSKKIRRAVIVDEWWEWFGEEGLGHNVRGLVKKLAAVCDDWLELRTKRFYDAIIPITHTLKNRLPEDIQTRCTVLHGGADADGLVAYSKQEARQRLGLNPEDKIVGLCNLCAEDHADNLPFLRGFNKAAARHADLKLLVSGQKKYLETQLKQLIKNSCLIDVGWQPYEKYNLYLSACDFFALPFPDTPRNAGRWPNKIGDFFQLKRMVITCPTGDLKKLFEENSSLGLCVDNSEEAYVEALETVCDAIAAGHTEEIPSNGSGILTMKQREQAVLDIYLSLMENQSANTAKK